MKDMDGVYYSWKECTKRIIFCIKWEHKEVFFSFADKEAMKWFKANDFGFKKRENP